MSAWVATGVAAVLAAGVVTTGTQPGHAITASTTSCTFSSKAVPSCGVLWGVATDNSNSSTTTLEQKVGRKFDVVYHFHGIDQTVPTSGEAQLVAGGRYLHINLESRRFLSSGQVRYTDITAGKLDSTLRAQAAAFKRLGKPVFVSYDHEPDSKAKFGDHGTPTEFKAAWRHIHNVYVNNGATNVVWVWVITGWKGNWTHAAELYPGNAYVDWLSWDPYNLASCQSGWVDPSKWLAFENTFKDTYYWLRNGGTYGTIDGTKPMMFSEFASTNWSAKPSAVAYWYSRVPTVLRNYPRIKAVETFNIKRDCDFRVTNYSTVLNAYATAGHDGYLNP